MKRSKGVRCGVLLVLFFLVAQLCREVESFTIGAKSSIEKCLYTGSEDELVCKERLVIIGDVPSGLLHETGYYQLTDVETPEGTKYIEPWTFYFKKSHVTVMYPLIYLHSSKDEIEEIYHYVTSSEHFVRQWLEAFFNWAKLIPREQASCKATYSLFQHNGGVGVMTCGMEASTTESVIDQGSRELIQGKYYLGSEGFCCDCIQEKVGFKGFDAGAYRAPNMYCKWHIFKESCVAMRTDKYHPNGGKIPNVDIYEPGNPFTEYEMQVTLLWKDKENRNYLTKTIRLSPMNYKGLYKEAGKFKVEIIGDYAGAQQAAQYPNKRLVFPRTSTPRNPDSGLHEHCVRNPEDRVTCFKDVMMLEAHLIDETGLSCNRVGVAWEAFQTQGVENCFAIHRRNCIRNQPKELRDTDRSQAASMDRALNKLVWNEAKDEPGFGGLWPIYRSSDSGQTRFDVQWAQRHMTHVRIEVSASDVRWIVRISPGKIIRAELKGDSFQAQAARGFLEVEIQNVGDAPAFYTVQVSEVPFVWVLKRVTR
uniref:Generative cell specific-1/HAP2 domain-containing protein n=1 Tax=Chromera velia CCMP2878 TaxID=1169474 RepID=A0A0K6SAT5_9ALVE|eukprot:Cvel_1802.t2-p1 / transcript=Cvel_1802.t2 / gene=Cvel_1802 / organism=Chromera_velia_CCMP2878 / gene_product=Protein HAPLESS 2-B, putative / transcript_product=Protein HAPLESS 2-B, putative / location=Cvel_scaffold66:72524-75079(+) / protein_length=533 / sequence_SO=supercontig / SO=protein_coding / is_pseudo=false